MKRLMLACVLVSQSATLFAQPAAPTDDEKPPVNVPLLMDALTHSDQRVRIQAANKLLLAGNEGVPALVNSLRNDAMLPATSATVILQRLGDNAVSAAPELLEIAADNKAEGWRWYNAVFLLRTIAPGSLKQALPAITRSLQGDDAMKQWGAVEALGALKQDGKPALHALKRLLETRHAPFVGVEIHEDILTHNSPAFTQTRPAYDDLRVLIAMRAVGAETQDVFPGFVRQVHRQSPDVRLIAATQLAQFGPEGQTIASRALGQIVSDYRSDLREQAIEEIVKIGAGAVEAVPALIELLNYRNSQLRRQAAIALGEIGPPAASAIPALKEALAIEALIESDNAEVMQDALDKIQADTPAPTEAKTALR